MKVGSAGNMSLSREYTKKLFGSMFPAYVLFMVELSVKERIYGANLWGHLFLTLVLVIRNP